MNLGFNSHFGTLQNASQVITSLIHNELYYIALNSEHNIRMNLTKNKKYK